ncbi:MAG: PIN domain-containing protein [Planctomycetota bacterium]|nr:PIN domain-containing protein [Planctomycetota bacterium]
MIDLPDISVWVALVYDGHMHHALAKAWFDTSGLRSAAFCRVTQMGLLRLLTNDKVMGEAVLSQREAWGVYDALCSDQRVVFAAEPPELEAHWRAFTASRHAAPKGWTDAYLAAFAVTHDHRLVSFDKGFRRYEGLKWLLLGGISGSGALA